MADAYTLIDGIDLDDPNFKPCRSESCPDESLHAAHVITNAKRGPDKTPRGNKEKR